MRLSSFTDQAIVLMQAAATRCGGGRVNAADLAEVTGISLPSAKKIVSQLTRAGLLTTARGMGGGIRLARPAAAISLADVIEAVEGPIALTLCVEPDQRHGCARETHCAMRPHWSPVNAAVRGALADVSLASLASRAAVGAPQELSA